MEVNASVLGIDIGTTSVKVCIVDIKSKEVIASQQKDTYSDVPSELGTEGNKQDVPRILAALQMCISRLPKSSLHKVVCIGVCGQMHGCMLWRKGNSWKQKEDADRFEIKDTSHLYTWQDSRCTREFLSEIPTPLSHMCVASGYGCATLLWFAKYQPHKLTKYDRAGTIHDFLVCMLCGLDEPIMSLQNAASWGFMNTETTEWNTELLESAGLPKHFLPHVIRSGEVAGKLLTTWYGIAAGTPVLASLGDFQCSVLPLLSNNTQAIFNISTSAQICFPMPQGFVPDFESVKRVCTVEHVPYFNGTYLAVAAALTGGNCLAAFVRMVQQWSLDLGFQVPQSKIWERIIKLGSDEATHSSLQIEPTIFGERHLPTQNAAVVNIDAGNLSLGKVTRALCKGIITNLHSMMPRSMLIDNEITQIVGGGSALVRNVVLQQELESIYQLPVSLNPHGDAAYGAALVAIRSQLSVGEKNK